ncbi:HlyD family type I secretion periplasmic adaptor subunit [Acidisphaera sp. L21]|uniref:HlyD family type I secretion periplasmic adaptor subunit n=1 Tax=Acidisphaera sp. L21 TaxID=1641851 RepID=UPI00131EBDB7|nr:HlyD family type I secretion periplasmic adaptor subunit [Acidisphaera sp. L21]
MSITTTTGTQLTRGQSAQMPSLLEFYSPSAALLEARPQGSARGVIWSVASMFAACALAAGLIPIDKVVTAPGKVVATETTIVVQPLETSIVREIAVQEGQIVHKGDLLARLDPTFTSSDKTATGQQVASLRAEVERLQAEAAGKEYQPISPDSAALVQESIFAQRKSERQFKVENYRQKIDALQATLSKAVGDIQSYTQRMQVASTVEGKRAELEKLGWGSQLNRLQATDQRMTMQAGLQEAQQTARSATGDLQAMRAEAAGYEENRRAQISQDLTDASRKLDDAQGTFSKASLRSRLVELRADQDATVLSRAPVSVGSVLQSGDQFLKLVPLNAPLEVEGTIAGADAGFVHLGDTVTIKFDTFPFTQYGSATGTVRVISPDSFTQPQNDQVSHGNQQAGQDGQTMGGQSYYRVRIAIEKVGLHDTPRDFRVTPGMPVTADVMVGKRTVLSYIFSRALPVAMDGMREP